MNKIIAVSIVALTLFGAGIASAQTYPYSSSACVNLTSNLSVGSRGGQVSSLQSFLVSQHYPGGGSWMITGYYGQATAAAVRAFQQNHGLPATGYVDSSTRSAINSASCLHGQGGGYVSPTYPTNPFSYNNYNYNNTYPYNYTNPTYNNFPYTYPYGGTLVITSMSQNTGVPGDSVTLTGVGFDAFNNTIAFGTQTIPGIPSINGTSLTFSVPSYYTYAQNQIVQISVSNSHGTSNSQSFTLYPYGSSYNPYNQYPYNQNQNQCGYPYSYGTNCGCAYGGYGCSNSGTPTVTFLSPNSGTAGTSVSVFGSGFSSTGNSVHFGNGIITNINSTDGHGVSFTVPSQITGYGSQPLVVGTYNVSVTNASGITSNTLPFIVTSVFSTSTTNTIALSSLAPTSGHVGTQITLTGTGFNTLDNTIHFGIGGTLHAPSFNSGTTIYYTVPSYVSPCDLIGPGCAAPAQLVFAGSYPIYVTNTNGSSATLSFQVQ